MYSIKIMSSEDMADSCVDKGFKMIMVAAGDTFEFYHDDLGNPCIIVFTTKGDKTESRSYPVTGNAYVMSETGKTVASFSARQKGEEAIATILKDYGDKAILGPRSNDSAKAPVINYLYEAGKTLKLTLDLDDPAPELTVSSIQQLISESRKAFPLSEPERFTVHDNSTDQLLRLRKYISAADLTDEQLRLVFNTLISERKGRNSIDQTKQFRVSVGTLMSEGVPHDIAMVASMHLG